MSKEIDWCAMKWRRVAHRTYCSWRKLEDKSYKISPLHIEIKTISMCVFPSLLPLSSQGGWYHTGRGRGRGCHQCLHTSTWMSTVYWLGSTHWNICGGNQEHTIQSVYTDRDKKLTSLPLSLLPCWWSREANSVELYDPSVRVQRAPEFRVAADSTDIVRVLQVKVAVGQQTASTHRDTGSLIAILQIGDTERKVYTYRQKRTV